MNWRKITVYFFIPLALVVPMVLMYFSGIEILQFIISPNIEGIYGNSNRELGLLESMQNVALLILMGLLVRGVFIHRKMMFRVGCAAALLVTAFVFLEEIDYGLHYYEFVSGVPAEEATEVRNWHNQGERTNTTKQIVDAGVVLWFVVAPLLLTGSAYPLVRSITPDRYAVLTVLAMFLVRSLAHGLQDAGFTGSGTMDSNLSEFRELVTYYLGMTYVYDVSERRLRGRSPLGESASEAATDMSDAIAAS